MRHIFISYSHKDKSYVHRLAETLQSEGFEVWIDDRIDYGTRWPLVIETAIDGCESFILVASSNSHESEWVQHEFTRAQRLKKKIFPLLLDGDPWISFESTQYFDVRGEKLPDQKFIDSLRNYEMQRVEVMRDFLKDNWPIYNNSNHGFSINYPNEGIISKETKEYINIDFPVLDGTNLQKKQISIHFYRGETPSSPLRGSTPILERSREIDILGVRFLYEGGGEGGMSRLHEWVSYSTIMQNRVVSLTLVLTSFPFDVMLPALVTSVDLVAEKDMLLYMLSTFTWRN